MEGWGVTRLMVEWDFMAFMRAHAAIGRRKFALEGRMSMRCWGIKVSR